MEKVLALAGFKTSDFHQASEAMRTLRLCSLLSKRGTSPCSKGAPVLGGISQRLSFSLSMNIDSTWKPLIPAVQLLLLNAISLSSKKQILLQIIGEHSTYHVIFRSMSGDLPTEMSAKCQCTAQTKLFQATKCILRKKDTGVVTVSMFSVQGSADTNR